LNSKTLESQTRALAPAIPGLEPPLATRHPTTILRNFVALLVACVMLSASAARADDGFRAFIAGLWPDAQAQGVSRAVFDKALGNIQPDLKLPDLILPGRSPTSEKGQAEFTRPPSEYVKRDYIINLAAQGRALATQHASALGKIEQEFGVDRYSVLAIWGRETAFGHHKLPHDGITVLATQAYYGRRKEMFRNELVMALKMIEVGVPRAKMRASWAGAMGLTQFMPSEYFIHTHDMDGDGKVDIFNSVPDALASAARQLHGKGWVRGQTWGYEVRVPASADCSLEGPTQARPLSEWAKLGFTRAAGRKWTADQLAQEAYLMMPAGGYGPAFLVLENYMVIRRYNTSDLYAVFVGHLADRIAGGGDFETPWGQAAPQKTATIREIQERLKSAGYEVEKIDGKVGSNTRKIIGSYQRAAKIKVDCWPTETVLSHLRSVASR
jgi:lytic murein transglycosylase